MAFYDIYVNETPEDEETMVFCYHDRRLPYLECDTKPVGPQILKLWSNHMVFSLSTSKYHHDATSAWSRRQKMEKSLGVIILPWPPPLRLQLVLLQNIDLIILNIVTECLYGHYNYWNQSINGFCPIFLLELTSDTVIAVKLPGGKILSERYFQSRGNFVVEPR